MVKKVAIFCGGPSSEHDVSLSSARSILKNINKKKYSPYIFYIKKDLKSAFYKAGKNIEPPKNTKFEDFTDLIKKTRDKFGIALLAALHGEFGEDGTIQLMLDKLNIKYTGSDHTSSVLCMNKYESMREVKKIKGLFFPKTKRLNIKRIKEKQSPINFPLVLKPNSLGSSVFVFIVSNQKEYEEAINEYQKNNVDDVLVQELISGIELSCGCLQTKKNKFIELPPIEIRPKSSFFDYSAKYEVDGSEEITPPVSISKKESDRISELTTQIHKRLQCSTYSRSDFIYRNGKIYFLETNTLPGFTATSLLPQEAEVNDMTFSELIDFIIEQSI